MRNPINLRRRREGIQAGSMADIAFLLLIFFLVTTTMDSEVGITRLMAPVAEAPPAPVAERDLFPVAINGAGELLVRGMPATLDELRGMAKDFLSNPENRADLPSMIPVDRAACQDRMAVLGDGPARALWAQRLEAVALIGPYREPSAKAHMVVQVAMDTPYNAYIAVQDELEGAVNDLRDEWAKRAFGRSYDALDEHNPEDRARILAIRRAVPSRIGDAEVIRR